MSTAAVPPVPSAFSWAAVGQTTLAVLTSVGYVLGTVLYWVGYYLVYALGWLLTGLYAVVSWPVSRLLLFLHNLFLPITYTLAYIPAPLVSFVRFLGQFQPLYVYLGSAAFIGAVTGLLIKIVSGYFFVALRIDAQSEKEALALRRRQRAQAIAATSAGRLSSSLSRPSTASSGQAVSRDDVWLWLEEFNPRKTAATRKTATRMSPKQKQRRQGLLSMTIMEESSTD